MLLFLYFDTKNYQFWNIYRDKGRKGKPFFDIRILMIHSNNFSNT